MLPRQPISTLFPYTTLFRSLQSGPNPGLWRRVMDVRITGAPWQWTREPQVVARSDIPQLDRKSTRLNSSHGYISYAVFCLKKKKNTKSENFFDSLKVKNQYN